MRSKVASSFSTSLIITAKFINYFRLLFVFACIILQYCIYFQKNLPL